MKTLLTLLLITLIGIVSTSCFRVGKDSYKLLDSNFPGMVSKPFGVGTLLPNKKFMQYCSFSPEGKGFYFSVTDSAWGKSTILKLNVLHPSQTDTLRLTSGDYQSEQFIDKSNSKMFFTSILFSGGEWNSDIYIAEKIGGKWGNAQHLKEPINSNMCEWHPTLTNKGVMYFASERNSDHTSADLYKAVPVNGVYETIERLPSPVNTSYNESDALIAPDESYLIFSSNRPGGISGNDLYQRPNGSGELDLYITFNKGNNQWTDPQNLGPNINTDAWEFGPALSPDGKYLFFTRRKAFKTLESSQIYWVSIKFIDQFREK